MLNEAVTHYHELLADADLAGSSLRLLDEGLERSKLISADGVCRLTSGRIRDRRRLARIVRVCETVWGAIEKVKDAAVGNDAMLSELGLTPIERELVQIDPGYRAVSPTARLDSFLTDEAYSFVELNGERPRGHRLRRCGLRNL